MPFDPTNEGHDVVDDVASIVYSLLGLTMRLARAPKRSVDSVSCTLTALGLRHMTSVVRLLPPNAVC